MNESKLSQTYDMIQLQSVKAMYCETVDDCMNDVGKASARLERIFTEDVKGDYGMGELVGRDAVVGFLVTTIGSSSESLWHAIHSPRIEIDGDTGTGRWTIVARMKTKGAASTSMIFGRYHDEFRRTPDGWRISSIRFKGEG